MRWYRVAFAVVVITGSGMGAPEARANGLLQAVARVAGEVVKKVGPKLAGVGKSAAGAISRNAHKAARAVGLVAPAAKRVAPMTKTVRSTASASTKGLVKSKASPGQSLRLSRGTKTVSQTQSSEKSKIVRELSKEVAQEVISGAAENYLKNRRVPLDSNPKAVRKRSTSRRSTSIGGSRRVGKKTTKRFVPAPVSRSRSRASYSVGKLFAPQGKIEGFKYLDEPKQPRLWTVDGKLLKGSVIAIGKEEMIVEASWGDKKQIILKRSK